MHSQRLESRSSRKPSTYERVARRVKDSKPRIQLWRYLVKNNYSTQSEILNDDTMYGARFKNRGTLSTYLNDLRDEGIVKRLEKGGRNDPDLWYVTEEFQPNPEVVIEETEVPRFDSLAQWTESHADLLTILLFLFVSSSVVVLYESVAVNLGGWPEMGVAASILGITSTIAVGVKEIHL